MAFQRSMLGLTGVAIGLASVLVGVSAGGAVADTTPTQTITIDLGNLDASDDAPVDPANPPALITPFDTSLGTLTKVNISVETTMDFAVCVTNTNDAEDAVSAGTASGTAKVDVPGAPLSDASESIDIPETPLAASDGTDDCIAWLGDDGLGSGPEPSTPDSKLFTQTKTASYTASITAADELAQYEGDDDIAYTYTSSSDSDLGQTQEWTKIFIPTGSAKLTVSYEYTPTSTPSSSTTTTTPSTTTTSTSTTTTPPPTTPVTTTPPTTPPLAYTGTSLGLPLGLAGAALLVGGGLVLISRRHRNETH